MQLYNGNVSYNKHRKPNNNRTNLTNPGLVASYDIQPGNGLPSNWSSDSLQHNSDSQQLIGRNGWYNGNVCHCQMLSK